MNNLSQTYTYDQSPDPENEENVAAELWRLWVGELKPHFEAEKDFLEKYGEKTGYGPDYISRVLADQHKMEELVWEKGPEGVRQFAKILATHIHFKNEFFTKRVCHILEFDGPATQGRH